MFGSFMPCYRAIPGKSDFYSPALEYPGPALLGSPAMLTSGFYPDALASGYQIVPWPNGGFPFEAPIDGSAGAGIAINATNYGVQGRDYLSAATGDHVAPGTWGYNFFMRLACLGNPDTPLDNPSDWFIAGVNLQGFPLPDFDIPWPLPYTPDPSNLHLEIPQPDSIFGVKFVDQFGSPFPITPNPYQQIHYECRIVEYEGSQVNIDGVRQIVIKIYFAVSQFTVPDVVRADKTRLLCYPKFTWDAERMDAVANYFNQFPVLLRYQKATAPGNIIEVPGRLGAVGYKSAYLDVHFVLTRPPCKFAGILNPCS